MKPDCLFCGIISGTTPSYKIYEDEHTYAFLDIHPINRGHTIVIPKTHHTNIYDTPAKEFERLMHTVQMLAPKIKQAVGADGINVGINNERAAGQIIFHLHTHIIPRFEGDGHANWHGNPYQDGEIATIKDIVIQEFK